MRISRQIASLAVVLAALAAGAPAAVAAPSRFGAEGQGAGEFQSPTGIAVNQESGDVYVVDRNNQRVQVFAGEGQFELAWGWGVADGSTEALQTCVERCFAGLEGTGAGQFSFPEGVAVDGSIGLSDGDVYVGDARNLRVEKFGPEGEFLLMFGREVNATTKSDVCDAGESCRAGAEVPEGSVAGPGEFVRLSGDSVAVNAAGEVYVGDENRVERFSPEGVVEPGATISLPGAGSVENLAVGSANHVYVQASGLAGVHEYDEGGGEVGKPRDETGVPGALALGGAGELFVSDASGGVHHILEYDSAGAQLASFDGGQESVSGIAYDERLMYVLNPGAVRLVTPAVPGHPYVLSDSESAAPAIEPATATLTSRVNPEGGAATSYRFEYGTTTSYGESSKQEPLPAGAPFEDQPASATIAGLAPDTTYHYRVVATNAAHESTEGPDETFTTLPPVSIDSASAVEVNDTSARLQAELNPHGLSTTYRFEYDTTPYGEGGADHGTKAPIPDGSVGAGTTDATVGELVQGLKPATIYHYRIVATNSRGTVDGPDHSLTTPGVAASGTEGPGAGGLPDDRAWELVSPVDKHGAPLEALGHESGILIQAAADGSAITYGATGPVGSEPAGNRSLTFSQVLSRRAGDQSPTGWESEEIATPRESVVGYFPGFTSEYKLFSTNLTSGIVEPEGPTPLAPQATEATPYRREQNGSYLPLVTAANVPPGTVFGGTLTEKETGVEFRAANPDQSDIALTSRQALTDDFAAGYVGGENSPRNVYEWSAGSLELVSQVPAGAAIRCGGSAPACVPAAEVGAGRGSAVGDLNDVVRQAVSNDGSRIVFESEGEDQDISHLYLRDVTLGETLELDVPPSGIAALRGRPRFQFASGDGLRIFFTDTVRLTEDATAREDQPDLYMCTVTESNGALACSLKDLTVDRNPGEAANVLGAVIGGGEDGNHVYFVANGALTPGASPGACISTANFGVAFDPNLTCNLYSVDTATGETTLVAGLSNGDSPDWEAGDGENLAQLTGRVSPNGRFLAFMSRRPLTGYDNRDVNSGERDEEVYLYDTDGSSGAGALTCASCNPSGARPSGVQGIGFPGLVVDRRLNWPNQWLAASIPGWTNIDTEHAIYQSRYLSDSGRLFFDAADALVPQDSNGKEDVYEYEPEGTPAGEHACTSATQGTSDVFKPARTVEFEGSKVEEGAGCVGLISSGTSGAESAFLDASENGDDVFFLTASRLAPADLDNAYDIYDAHVCTAESPCPPPPPTPPPACQGDACQNSVAVPGEVTPGSLTFHGPGNQTAPAAVKQKAKPLTRAQKLAKALKTCKTKKNKRKRQACEKTARKRFGPVKKKSKKTVKKQAK